MKKVKSNKFNKILLYSIGGLFAFALTLIPSLPAEKSLADEQQSFSSSSSGFSVVMHGKNGDTLNPSSTTITVGENNVDSYSVLWKELSYFEVEFSDNLTETDTYSYQYNIRWTPAEIKNETIDLSTDRVESVDIVSSRVDNQAEIKKSIKFYIEDTVDNTENSFKPSGSIEEKQTEVGKWGIYQFSFICNGKTWASPIYEVVATKVSELTERPLIKEVATRSNYSIDNAYICTISDGDYQYVNRQNLVWKVKGRGSDGANYVLLPEDITSGDKSTKSILPSNSHTRTGISFSFDFDISGKWEITCTAIDTETQQNLTSNVIEVSTVKVVPSYLYIIVIAAAVVVAAIVLTIIIIRSKKKEKVW